MQPAHLAHWWPRIVASAILLFGPFSAVLADSFTARITNLLFWESGDLVYVYVEGGTQNRPSCAGSNGDYLSFAMTRPRAKEYLAGLMMAFAADRTVTFYTLGACVDQSVSDTINYFIVNR